MSRFPVAFPPPAFASRSSCSRRGIGPSSRSAYRTGVRTSTGLPRSARMSYDRNGCPLYPEDGGASPGQVDSLTGACRSSAASPYTPLQHPSREALLDEASTRVQAIHPSGLPLARDHPDGTGRRFGFPPGFAPRRPRAKRRTPRWGQANEHGPGTTRSTSHQLILQSVVHSQRATSRRTSRTNSRPVIALPSANGGREGPALQHPRRLRPRGTSHPGVVRSRLAREAPPPGRTPQRSAHP
jgi:hypothetical protein